MNFRKTIEIDDKVNYKSTLLKFIIVGDSGVGKTNIINRYINNHFNCNNKNTIGVDFFSKNLKIKNNIYKLQIWDTAGQERFKTINNIYYKNCFGYLLVFDISNKSSFDNLNYWLNEIKSNTNKTDLSKYILILGNKSDLTGQIDVNNDLIQSYISENNFIYYPVSAKDNNNIKESIEFFITEITKNIDIESKLEASDFDINRSNSINIKKKITSKKNCC